MKNNEQIENLEIKIAELQRDMQAISETVILQQREINHLKHELVVINDKVAQSSDNLSHEKPPHY